MLLNIPAIIPPELLMALDKMGHTDEIVIADCNYPALSMSRECTIKEPIYVKGATVPQMMDAVLSLIPLDYREQKSFIGVKPLDSNEQYPVHDEYPVVLSKHGYGEDRIQFLSKPEFYSRAEHAFCVVVTGEKSKFANVIIRKGIV